MNKQSNEKEKRGKMKNSECKAFTKSSAAYGIHTLENTNNVRVTI